MKELKNSNHRLTVSCDLLKDNLTKMNSSTQKQISKLQDELAECKSLKDEMHKYIRALEQKNDDLERTNRCAMFSLGEFEAKLNEALERNAILESELDEKDELAETVQRLRDEARDLKQELAVRQIKSQKQENSIRSNSIEGTTVNNDGNNNSNSNFNLNNSCPMETDTSFSSQSTADDKAKEDKVKNSELANNVFNIPNVHQNPVTSSIRISALNFVGDSLRKITSMEARLLAARNLMRENNRDRRSATISSIESS
ncbi:nuclear distribution nudE-like 1, partial [Brachionus plicatilis]